MNVMVVDAVETREMTMVLVMVMVEVWVLVSARATRGRSAAVKMVDSCILMSGWRWRVSGTLNE